MNKMSKLNRFKKVVKQFGGSRIVNVSECKLGEEVYVFTESELELLGLN